MTSSMDPCAGDGAGNPPGFKCEPAPPACLGGTTPLLLPNESWSCIGGCDMVIDYGGPNGNVRTCTPQPNCPQGQASLWREDLGLWTCGTSCSDETGISYDANTWGRSTLCTPC